MGAAHSQPAAQGCPRTCPSHCRPFCAVLGSRDGGTPFLEDTETRSELRLHWGFSLRDHPGATSSQHSSLCSGGVWGCLVRMPHKVWLALLCWWGWCSVPVKVRVSSGSINRLIDIVFCPVNKHQQIKNEKKNGHMEHSMVPQRRQSRKARRVKEQNMKST